MHMTFQVFADVLKVPQETEAVDNSLCKYNSKPAKIHNNAHNNTLPIALTPLRLSIWRDYTFVQKSLPKNVLQAQEAVGMRL